MVEIDVRKFGMKDVTFASVESAWTLAKRYWYHFLSLISIVAFMTAAVSSVPMSPELSVFWATVVAFVTSFLRRDTTLIPYEFFRGGRGFFSSGFIKALAGGSLQVLNVAATCAGAGIIVGVVTLTGLGLKFSSIVLAYAGNSLLLTAIYTALIVWIVGLAVPVTASYIICAVIAAPALITLKVPEFAAHMFIFYYAVLSEVSPPTALSPFAAAAITGGDPYKTTLQCWKYTTPAFLVPFMFVLDPAGTGLLLTGSCEDARRRQLGLDRAGHLHRGGRHHGACRRLPGLAVQDNAVARAPDAARRRRAAGLSQDSVSTRSASRSVAMRARQPMDAENPRQRHPDPGLGRRGAVRRAARAQGRDRSSPSPSR